MKTKLFYLLLYLAIGCQVPKYSIHGKVLDATSKVAVPEAIIKLNRHEIKTDLEGNFSTSCRKKNKIEVSATGFYTLEQSIKLKRQVTNLIIELNPVPLKEANVKWSGGYSTIIDEFGNFKCVPIKNKN